MFIDYTVPDHPRYKIAVATGSDLSSFSLRGEQPITDWLGGDAVSGTYRTKTAS